MKHGTISGYGYHKCRCSSCRRANADYMLTWARAHPKSRLETKRKYNREHRLEVQLRCRRYYMTHVKNQEASNAWKRAHPEKRRAWNTQRQARKHGAAGYATAEQIAARITYYGGRCWMCGAPATEIDHVIPLARGGSNWPANLRPACRSCNARKGARVA